MYLDAGGPIWKGMVEEARKVAKPQTELGDPDKEMVCLSLQECLLFPLFVQSPKVLHVPGKLTQEEIFMPVEAEVYTGPGPQHRVATLENQ